MFWLKPLSSRGVSSEGDNHDTQVAWLRVEGPVATRAQIAEARKTFALHLDTISLSVAGYHTIDYKLPDGSRLRVVSNSGIHNAVLWTKGGGDTTDLPHGFLVVTNWGKPSIFKRRPGDGDVSWAVDSIKVPQASQDIAADNQVFRERQAGSYFVHPMVLTAGAQRSLWDFLKHAEGDLPSSDVLPICIAQGSVYKTRPTHYAHENTVLDRDGNVLYTMELSTPILIEFPETPRFGSCTTANGERLVLQHSRIALVSESFDIYFMRLASEVIRRTPEGDYEAVQRVVTGINGPFGSVSPPSGPAVPGLGEDILPLNLKAASHSVGGSTGAYIYIEGYSSFLIAPPEALSESAFSHDYTYLPDGPELYEGTLALAGPTGVEYPDLIAHGNAEGSELWRYGYKRLEAQPGVFSSTFQRWYGTFLQEKQRQDSQYSWAANPFVKYELGWNDLKLLEGSAAGSCAGKYHVDLKKRGRNSSWWDGFYFLRDYIAAGFNPFPVAIDDGSGGSMLNPEFTAWFEANNIKAEIVAEVSPNPPGFGGSENIFSEVVADAPEENAASYDYTSRYVIDFDHKGQFWAAVVVRVVSTGLLWERGAYRGDMVRTNEATVTVSIHFESNWRGTVDTQLLASATSVTRPPFEYTILMKQNPYFFEVPGSADKQTMMVRMPPVPGIPIEAMSQMQTLMSHQGVNPHLACADVRNDITDPKVISKQGIEFSQMLPTIKPHTKFVSGQLYARTFKLSDFPDALWLLSALKCDAAMDDSPSGEKWHYLPDLKDTIDTQDFHIEVRDGVIEQWSDEFFAGPEQPEPTDREINLYRI